MSWSRISPDGHPFLYRGDVFLFLHGRGELEAFSALAEEFRLKVIMSEGLDDLFALPALYQTARGGADAVDRRALSRGQRVHGRAASHGGAAEKS